VCIVDVDLLIKKSKAFDSLAYWPLAEKLEKIGITGSLLNWFRSYLSRRKQSVVIHGAKSDEAYIRAGVPQGSILGPLLFLIYVNDLILDINSTIKLFADDTFLYIVVENATNAAEMINSDLTKINELSKQWLVKFNPSKPECLTISLKNRRPFHPALYFDNEYLTEIDFHKHLGVIISNDLSWNLHVDPSLMSCKQFLKSKGS
jgi:hypothetical protein